MPIGGIPDEALSDDVIPTPKKIPSPDNVDPTFKCWYHRNTGIQLRRVRR